ncbi:hypothetical protein E4U38_003121 [Claviceps purpurea]|nr:hypothetical protein E4U38_003121 [Claviceps purpurea]
MKVGDGKGKGKVRARNGSSMQQLKAASLRQPTTSCEEGRLVRIPPTNGRQLFTGTPTATGQQPVFLRKAANDEEMTPNSHAASQPLPSPALQQDHLDGHSLPPHTVAVGDPLCVAFNLRGDEPSAAGKVPEPNERAARQ